MPSWKPDLYLTYADLRTRPSRDLAQRVEVSEPLRMIDLGCGPGNSTNVCAARWPLAAIVGMDSSAAMIEKARADNPGRDWRVGEIAAWVEAGGERFDVVFSNAALQWVGDHRTLFPKLLGRVAPGGALAVQMPAYTGAPNTVMRELAASDGWRTWFPTGRAEEWYAHDLEFYYETLAPHASRLDLWATDYLHVMPEFSSIIEWYQGTGLRPYLDSITEESERQRFIAGYSERLRPLFPEAAAGGVLFTFRRIFIVAYS